MSQEQARPAPFVVAWFSPCKRLNLQIDQQDIDVPPFQSLRNLEVAGVC